MAFCRSNISSIFIDGKTYTLVGSNLYYNEFALATLGAASRPATPVEAAPDVAIPAAKTT